MGLVSSISSQLESVFTENCVKTTSSIETRDKLEALFQVDEFNQVYIHVCYLGFSCQALSYNELWCRLGTSRTSLKCYFGRLGSLSEKD